MKNKTKKTRNVQIWVRVSREEKLMLQSQANLHLLTMSDFIRQKVLFPIISENKNQQK